MAFPCPQYWQQPQASGQGLSCIDPNGAHSSPTTAYLGRGSAGLFLVVSACGSPGLIHKLAVKMPKVFFPQRLTSRGPCVDRSLSSEYIFLGPVMGVKPHRPRAGQCALKSPGFHPS